MNLKEAVVHVFQNYANFNGRARRSEYWYFRLFDLIVPTIVSIVTLLPGLITGDATLLVIFGLGKILLAVYGLASIVPSLAVTCRRLHDVGKPGSYMFFFLLPIVGTILILVWAFQDGDPGENRYGANPKEENSADYKKKCPHCGAVIKPHVRFCGNCGANLTEDDLASKTKVWICSCGKENPIDCAFCPNCGRRHLAESVPPAFAKCEKCGRPIPAGQRLCANCASTRPTDNGSNGFKPPKELG